MSASFMKLEPFPPQCEREEPALFMNDKVHLIDLTQAQWFMHFTDTRRFYNNDADTKNRTQFALYDEIFHCRNDNVDTVYRLDANFN